MGKHIAFLLSNGFSVRMITQTGLLARLAAGGIRISLLVPDIEDPGFLRVREETGVELVEYIVEEGWMRRGLFHFRKFVLNDIEANPALLEKYMVRRTAKDRSPLKRGFDYLEYGAFKTAKRFPVIRKGFQRFEARLLRSEAVQRQLRELQPDWLVCTYPVMSPEPEYLLAAREVGIPSVLQLLSWDNITAKGQFPALADRYGVWGDCMADELKEYYNISEGNINRLGVPHFDRHHQALQHPEIDRLAGFGLDPAQPYLFVAMSAPRYCPREIDIVEWLANRAAAREFQLLVRPHPQNVTGDMADKSWLHRLEAVGRLDNVGLFMPRMNVDSRLLYSIDRDDLTEFSQLLAGAAMVLNSGSTVSIDAMMCGRPVVLTSFDAAEDLPYWQSARRLKDYVHLHKFISHGGVKVTSNYAELEAAITTYLEEPTTDAKAREATVRYYCLAADGRATERSVAFYEELLAE